MTESTNTTKPINATTNPPRGVFIVIDGIDGSGKGYCMMRLQEYIMGKSKKYDHLLLTREPTNSLAGQQLREILAKEADPVQSARKCLELFVTDRRQHGENHIKPAITKNYIILCDRFKYATMSYQQAQGLSFEEVKRAHDGILVPDLTLILDCPVDVALERRYSNDISKENKFENQTFLEKVRQNYLRLPSQLIGEKIVIIDASKPREEVARQIFEAVENAKVLPY